MSSPTSSIDLMARPSAAGTKRQLLFLAVGLLSFAILWAVPVAMVVWLFGFAFGSVGIAELLEHTRGLAPTTYGGAFWLGEVRGRIRDPSPNPACERVACSPARARPVHEAARR